MNHCAIQISKDCSEVVHGKRGICSRCYKHLVKAGLLELGAKFTRYPEWLKEMIRIQDAYDHKNNRHPVITFDAVLELELA